MKSKNGKIKAKTISVLIIILIIAISSFLLKNNSNLSENIKSGHKNNIQITDRAEKTKKINAEWNLLLVNYENKIPGNFAIELKEMPGGEKVDSRIYNDLSLMFEKMESKGLYPVVVSGYRTVKKQKKMMKDKISELRENGYSKSQAEDEAMKWVSAVGYSEHQTGLAVDINADGINSRGTQIYEWLSKNAWKYGFILRYPENKEQKTGISFEPWHYRYVGRTAAKEITKKGLCLEEYLNI